MSEYYLADYLEHACNYCKHVRQRRDGLWWCTCHESDYSPAAEWDDEEEDESECPSFDPDPDCYDDDDDCDDCDWD